MFLRAFFDASERESGVFTVAGYLFDAAQGRKFRREWRPVFEPYGGLHMTDLANGTKSFSGLSRGERDHLVKVAVSRIRERALAGVTVSCWVQDIERHSPRWIRGFGGAYPICCHLAMSAMGNWARNNNYRQPIAYVFEAGDERAAEADELLSNANHVEAVRDAYMYRSHTFATKADPCSSHLEAADFLAWEWGKYFAETMTQNIRPMRLSFAHLICDRFDRYQFRPIGGEHLLRFFESVSQLGIEQWQEQARADDLAVVRLDDTESP